MVMLLDVPLEEPLDVPLEELAPVALDAPLDLEVLPETEDEVSLPLLALDAELDVVALDVDAVVLFEAVEPFEPLDADPFELVVPELLADPPPPPPLQATTRTPTDTEAIRSEDERIMDDSLTLQRTPSGRAHATGILLRRPVSIRRSAP
jgi:hypothetical protein